MGLLGASLRDLENARPMDVAIVDANGDHVTTFNGTVSRPATATLASVPASETSVVLLAANPARRQAIIVNDGSKRLYVAFAPTATRSSFTVLLSGGATYELPLNGYTGVISGVWSDDSGNARITEVTA